MKELCETENKAKRIKVTNGGTGFCGLLTLVFIVLKLLDLINWSWWWVLAPVWIPFAVAIVIYIVTLTIILIKED